MAEVLTVDAHDARRAIGREHRADLSDAPFRERRVAAAAEESRVEQLVA